MGGGFGPKAALPKLFLIRPGKDRLVRVRIVVTEVTGHGSIRRGVLDTAWHSDADRCKDLIKQVALDEPRPYRPEVGRPVYEICVDDKTVWVAWRDLVGPLRELVIMAILTDRPPSGPARRRDEHLMETQPVPGEHAGHDASGEVGTAQPEDMTARSSDRPQPGDRRVAVVPVPRRGGEEDVQPPDGPGRAK